MPKKKYNYTKKTGRPHWTASEEELKKVEDLGELGLNQAQIADCLGIGYSTLFEKKNIYPELAEAIKRGKAKGIAKVTAALIQNVNSGNVTAQIFYLKCQAGWKESKEDTGADASQSLMQKLIDKL